MRSLEQEDVRGAVNQDNATLSRTSEFLCRCICVAGMGSGTLCSDLATGTHSAVTAVHCQLPVPSPCPNQGITLGTHWGSEASGDSAVTL